MSILIPLYINIILFSCIKVLLHESSVLLSSTIWLTVQFLDLVQNSQIVYKKVYLKLKNHDTLANAIGPCILF